MTISATDRAVLGTWEDREEYFAAAQYSGKFRDAPEIVIGEETGLVLSAVHGVKHKRRGVVKEEDEGTGGLCSALGYVLGLTTAIVHDGELANDANSDPDHPIKTDLANLSLPANGGVLVDLHGMSVRRKKGGQWSEHGQDIVIGLGKDLGNSRAVGELLRDAFIEQGLVVDFGGDITTWRAQGAGTMTMWAQNRGCSAVQIEILDRFRQEKSDRQEKIRLVHSLINGLRAVRKMSC